MCRVYSRLSTSFLVVLFSAFSVSAFSQSANELEELISKQEKQAASLQTQQSSLQAEQQAKKAELAPLLSRGLPGNNQLEEARSALIKAQLNYQQDGSERNQSRLRNAEFKLALAERRFKKTNENMFTLQQEIQQLEQQITSNQGVIAQVVTAIESNRSKLGAARSAQLARQQAAQQAREADQQKAKADAAEKEIRRLKAELEEQKRIIEEKSGKAETKTKPELETANTQTTSQISESNNTSGEPALSLPPSSAQISTPPVTPVPVENAPIAAPSPINQAATSDTPPKYSEPKKDAQFDDSSGISLLLTANEVEAYQSMVNELASQAEGYGSKNRRIMTIKPVVVSDKNDLRKDKLVTLIPMGNNIYRGEQDIDVGDTIFIVGLNRWRQSIPPIAAGDKDFIFIFNNSNNESPQLVYFPQALSAVQQP